MTDIARRRAHRFGIVAEYLCAALLILKGYSIIAMRQRNRMGEMDIIASRGKLIVFVEVKARGSEREALESVSADKRGRIERAATAFVAKHARYAQHGLRFDVMVVTSPWKIRHLKDAWRVQ